MQHWTATWDENQGAYRIYRRENPEHTIAYAEDTKEELANAKEQAHFYGATLKIERRQG